MTISPRQRAKDRQHRAESDARHKVDDPDRDRLAAALHDDDCGWNCQGHGIMQEIVDARYGRLADTALKALDRFGRLVKAGP